jgi:hypothetical protein
LLVLLPLLLLLATMLLNNLLALMPLILLLMLITLLHTGTVAAANATPEQLPALATIALRIAIKAPRISFV